MNLMNAQNDYYMNNRIGGGYRRLGTTDVWLTPLGFGCASVWGKKLISDAEAQLLFEHAYRLGIRYFDTGYSYGIAEERIGGIFRSSKIVDRNDLVISTKFGTKHIDGKYVKDFSPEWMEKSVQISLGRMGLDHLDCLLCHGPRIADFTEDFFNKLEELKQQGLVKAVGANTFDTNVLEYIRDHKCFDYVMLDYNIMRQDREPLIQSLYENGIGVIAGAPLAESLYSNRVFKIRSMKDLWYLARAVVRFRGQLFEGRKYRFINKVQGITGTQIALKYVVDNPYVTSAVFGTSSIAHLDENVEALTVEIPEEIIEKLHTIGGLK